MTTQPTDILITRLGADDFADLHPIYTEALPASERKPDDVIRLCLTRPDYLLFGARRPSGQLLGFASFYRSASYPFTLLEYLATDHQARSQGIGAKLVQAGLAAAPNIPMLAEVDAVHHDDAPDAFSRRRQQFYRRLGCEKLENIPYRMPQVSAEIPPPMDLFIHRGGPALTITHADLHAWLMDIYQNVYDQQDPASQIDAIMAPASRTAPLTTT